MELAPYNIKVNSICPGNYYDGPLWSDRRRVCSYSTCTRARCRARRRWRTCAAYYLSKSLIKRGCLPSDVALALTYLVEQKYETGQALPVTGGQIMLS